MPCGDNGFHECDPIGYEGHKLLCRLVKIIKVKDPVLLAHIKNTYPNLARFINQHEREDRERIARKRTELASRRVRKAALKKLSAAERRALGVV